MYYICTYTKYITQLLCYIIAANSDNKDKNYAIQNRNNLYVQFDGTST